MAALRRREADGLQGVLSTRDSKAVERRTLELQGDITCVSAPPQPQQGARQGPAPGSVRPQSFPEAHAARTQQGIAQRACGGRRSGGQRWQEQFPSSILPTDRPPGTDNHSLGGQAHGRCVRSGGR
jgi:hypothetical protein